LSILDWVILGFTALLALYGYAQGFLVGALSLIGFAVGGFLGTRIAPVLLHGGEHSTDAPLFTLVGALLVGGVCASGLEAFGGRLRDRLRVPGFRALDGLLGALLTGCVALGIAWIAGAIALDSSSSRPLRSDIDGSQILRTLDRMLAPSQLVIGALSHFDPLPTVHGPAANVAAPSVGILATVGARSARASVVKVYGMACGLGIEGSGWVAAPDLIVTNAHVVAGERDPEIQVHGTGAAIPVTVVVFDVRDDLAVLRARALPLAPLAMAPVSRAGEPVAILGYPLDGPFRTRAGRLGQIQVVDTQNAYGRGHVMREIEALRGTVKPGNSGGPLVDSEGRVRATVFAAITGTARPGGFAIPDDVVRTVMAHARGRYAAVSTGHCAE
jgi:S1-C subfamily serine protease